MRSSAVHEQLGTNIGRIDQVLLRGHPLVDEACSMGSVHSASWTVAGVVYTCVSRWGAVGSHVSLMCTIYPVHCVSRLCR